MDDIYNTVSELNELHMYIVYGTDPNYYIALPKDGPVKMTI